jgi:hypothetical protein
MSAIADTTRRATGAIALGLVAIAAVTALTVHAVAARSAREWLDFPFGGMPATPGKMADIFANNVKMLFALFAACVVARLARDLAAAPTARGMDLTSLFARALVLVCDVAVIASALAHAVIVGGGVGAYGTRMVAALLPHGPFELLAYSLVLALYANVRRGPVDRGTWLACGSLSVAGLALAAPIEVLFA